MKKVISIIVALALVLGLSIAATPVLADVTVPKVDVDPAVVSVVASYSITFNITSTLGTGATVSVKFPTGTTVPAKSTYQTGDITVQGWDVSHGDIAVSGQVVTITLREGIGAIGEVIVVFTKDAGITNPTTPKSYTLEVMTSKEPKYVTSQPYPIPLPEKSEYQFVYAPPALISEGSAAEVGVTLKTKVLGKAGYPEARIHFSEHSGPGSVDFSVWYGGSWSSPAPSGSYPSPSGTFDLKDNHDETFQFRLTFSEVGVYTLSFTVVDVTTNATVSVLGGKPTFACAGVTEVVVLTEGWNLVSLPIIPDESAIATVLAGIGPTWQEKVESVWYYDPTFTNASDRWRSYKPGQTNPRLTKIEDGKAYWINMNAATPLTVAGVAIVLPGLVPPTYSVRAGWNMVGFKSRSTNTTVDDYLQGTQWVRVLEFKNGNWRSLPEDEKMKPGLGYWVAFSEPGIIYP